MVKPPYYYLTVAILTDFYDFVSKKTCVFQRELIGYYTEVKV